MPQFEYEAVDHDHRPLRGHVEAGTANEAVVLLSQQGYRVSRIAKSDVIGVPPVVRPASVPAVSAPIVQSSAQQRPVATPRVSPVVGDQWEPVYSDADTFFFFSQFASMVKAGITVYDALQRLGTGVSIGEKGRAACLQIAASVNNGRSLAQAMEPWKGMFSPGAVGAVAAGELGGYLWEALEQVAYQAEQAMALRRTYKFLVISIFLTFALLPFVMIGINAFSGMAVELNVTAQENFASLGDKMKAGLLGFWGWFLVLSMVAWFGIRAWTARPQQRDIRHRLAAKTPVFSRRARLASLEAFSFHHDRLLGPGIAPYRAWEAAAAAVPNSSIREELLEAGRDAREGTSVVQIAQRTSLIPQEFQGVIATAEMTGALPQAFEQIRRYSMAEREGVERGMSFRAKIWTGLVMFGVGILTYGFVTAKYIGTMLDGMMQNF